MTHDSAAQPRTVGPGFASSGGHVSEQKTPPTVHSPVLGLFTEWLFQPTLKLTGYSPESYLMTGMTGCLLQACPLLPRWSSVYSFRGALRSCKGKCALSPKE